MPTLKSDEGGSSWKPEPANPLAQSVHAAGFAYDGSQDILVSRTDAWQHTFGFCQLYDESAPLTISAIIDCEPIRFSHGGKDWMIELWKGQYGLETGAEVGVYSRPSASAVSRAVSDAFSALFPIVAPVVKTLHHQVDWYPSAEEHDWLTSSITLKRTNGHTLFVRGPESHWWLTGFRWGEFSEPEDLVAEIEITLKNDAMRAAFEKALPKYRRLPTTRPHSVAFVFDRQTRPLPVARTTLHDKVQGSNRSLVDAYERARRDADVSTNDPNVVGKAFAAGGASTALSLVKGYFDTVHASRDTWNKAWARG